MYNKNTKRYNKKEGNPVQNFKLKKKNLERLILMSPRRNELASLV